MDDEDGEYGWPCGTCTCHLLAQLGVTEQNAGGAENGRK